jgi:hypothetical protein
MTPRNIQSLSDLVIQQSSKTFDEFDLRQCAPIMGPLLPKMLKGQLIFENDPGQQAPYLALPGRFYACYHSREEVCAKHPRLQIIKGLPYAVYASKSLDCILDFAPYGFVALSREALGPGTAGVHQHVLPPLLEYALSPDLWGPHGKWARFDARLHTQFEKYKLLNPGALPGRYPLKELAQRLEKRGIKGDLRDGSFILTMPWTFSLTALKKLEGIIQEEF